jgi:MATE family multidrug resistance protein
MVINMFSYWALGFPLAYMATITYQAPPSYIWGGFVLGLTVAAILLTRRFLGISKALLFTAPTDTIRG